MTPLGAQRGELAADDLAGLGDVVLAGADVDGDHAAVDVLLGVGADRVGEAALLADLAEQPRGGRAAEDRVEDAEREAAIVAAGDPGRAEADVVLLGLLRVEAEPRRRSAVAAGGAPRRVRRRPAARRARAASSTIASCSRWPAAATTMFGARVAAAW